MLEAMSYCKLTFRLLSLLTYSCESQGQNIINEDFGKDLQCPESGGSGLSTAMKFQEVYAYQG